MPSYTAYESGYGAVHVYTPLNLIGTMANWRRVAYVLQTAEGNSRANV